MNNGTMLYAPPRGGAVRRVPAKKARRLRIAWFVIGAIFGFTTAFMGKTIHSIVESAVPVAEKAAHKAANVVSDVVVATMDAAQSATIDSPEPSISAIPQSKPVAAIAAATKVAEMKVRKGDTLINMLTKKGVEYQEAHTVVEALKPHYDPRNLVVGQKLEVELNSFKDGYDVEALRIKLSTLKTLELIQPVKDSFTVAMHEAQVDREVSAGGGTITSSLYQTGVDNGVPPAILSTLINAYSYDVDFQREIRRNDSFNAVFETLRTDDGNVAGYGDLLYATLTLGGKEMKIYHFTRPNGDEGFYTSDGKSVRKALLRTPLNGARLSSGFGMRKHPISGYSRMHKGVDFAAPTGTPVYAAGDGTIEYAGRKGSYGNYVRLRHNNQYSTAYAHLHRVAKGSRSGKRVKQGDVIGYVGSTGASTGPHLHYEVLSGGKQVNPKNLKLPTGHTLKGQELAAFKENIKQVNLLANRLIKGEPAMAAAQ